MAIRNFVFPHSKSSLASYPLNPAPFGFKAPHSDRAATFAAAKPKPVRKSKAAQRPASCSWYEAEDRNIPSVSSF